MKVGQKVVCVNNRCQFVFGELPAVGEIYTIRDIRYFPGYGVGIWLVEIVNTPVITVCGKMEMGFAVERFRPVDESFGEEVSENLQKHFRALERVYKIYGE